MDLVLGLSLDLSHWAERTDALRKSFAGGYDPHLRVEQDTVNGLPALVSSQGRGAAVIIDHPPWRHDEAHWNPAVRRAVTEMRGRGLCHVAVSDVNVLDRTPIKLFNALLEGA